MRSKENSLVPQHLMPGEIRDFRILLEGAFVSHRKENPFYSLRSFAKKIGLMPCHLSRILSGEKRLSKEVARQIAKRLKLPVYAAERFCYLVSAKCGRSRYERNIALMALNKKLIRNADKVLREQMGIQNDN